MNGARAMSIRERSAALRPLRCLTRQPVCPIHPPPVLAPFARGVCCLSNRRQGSAMKVRSSLKSLKGRHRDCKVVRRKGRVYVINKTDPRFKARQG